MSDEMVENLSRDKKDDGAHNIDSLKWNCTSTNTRVVPANASLCGASVELIGKKDHSMEEDNSLKFTSQTALNQMSNVTSGYFPSSGGFNVSSIDQDANNSSSSEFPRSVGFDISNRPKQNVFYPKNEIDLNSLNNFYFSLVPKNSHSMGDDHKMSVQGNGSHLSSCQPQSIQQQEWFDTIGFEAHPDDLLISDSSEDFGENRPRSGGHRDSTSADTEGTLSPIPTDDVKQTKEKYEDGNQCSKTKNNEGISTKGEYESIGMKSLSSRYGYYAHHDNVSKGSQSHVGTWEADSNESRGHDDSTRSSDRQHNSVLDDQTEVRGKNSDGVPNVDTNCVGHENSTSKSSLPSTECSSVKSRSDNEESDSVETEEDEHCHKIRVHADALTIYDCLGEEPVMFSALMCVAPEDIILFGLPFLHKLKCWGFDIFLPERDLNLTGPYYENLARVIKERCNGKVIVIVSKNYPRSEECLFLTNFAKQLDPASKERSIIPIYIDKEISNLPNVLAGLSSIRYNQAYNNNFLYKKILLALRLDTSGILPEL